MENKKPEMNYYDGVVLPLKISMLCCVVNI